MNKYLLVSLLLVLFSCDGFLTDQNTEPLTKRNNLGDPTMTERDAWGDPTIATEKHEVVNPYFSINPGLYDGQISVSIISPYRNVETFYTLDGTEPTKASQHYSNSIIIRDGEALSIRAVSYLNDIPSSISEAFYKVDKTYDLESYDEDLTLEGYSENLSGVWKGYVETPWHGVVSAELIVNNQGVYTPKSLSRYFYQANDQENMNFYVESDETVLYYGSDGTHSRKQIKLYDLYDDGRANGDIDLIWPDSNEPITEKIENFTFRHNQQVMEFRFKRTGACCYVNVTLTKVE